MLVLKIERDTHQTFFRVRVRFIRVMHPVLVLVVCMRSLVVCCVHLVFKKNPESYKMPWDAGVKGKRESVFHLMPESMVCRLDPLPAALFSNSYGIRNRPEWE